MKPWAAWDMRLARNSFATRFWTSCETRGFLCRAVRWPLPAELARVESRRTSITNSTKGRVAPIRPRQGRGAPSTGRAGRRREKGPRVDVAPRPRVLNSQGQFLKRGKEARTPRPRVSAGWVRVDEVSALHHESALLISLRF